MNLKMIKKILFYGIFFLSTLAGQYQIFPSQTFATDLLNKAYQESSDHGYVIKNGDNPKWVANEIFGNTTTVNVFWSWDKATTQWPYIVRIVKFLIRRTIILAVPIIIWCWIQYVLAVWDSKKEEKSRKTILYVLLWIFLALWSLAIVQLVLTITTRSLGGL
jgi:hypothetical protein